MLNTIAGKEPPVGKIVAEEGGTMVGSVVLIPAGTVFHGPNDEEFTTQWPEVRLLAVPPSSRGKGIGSILLGECIRRARESGSNAITLHTPDMMHVAMQLYDRRGFVRMPEIAFIPAHEVDIQGYRLQLASVVRTSSALFSTSP